MPWYFPWSDSIKKRACRYLLHHYVGQFLQEKLSLEQLSVDLFNGKGIVKDVPLDVLSLNEMLDGANVPIEILDGFIKTIAISVPWSSLMQDNCELEIQGLEITVRLAKKNVDMAASIVSDSMSFASMTTSLQIAQECLKDDDHEANSAQTFEGLESFAQTIESVLSRIKVRFEDVMIRFEHVLPAQNRKSGVGLELHLKRVEYSDLSTVDSGGDPVSNNDVYDAPTMAHKQLDISGLQLSLDEFHESSRTLLRDSIFTMEQRPSSPSNSIDSSPPLSPYQSAVFSQSVVSNPGTQQLLPPVVILSSAGRQEARVKWRLDDSCPSPKVEFEYFLGTLNILVSPKQLHLLTDLMNDIKNQQNADDYLNYTENVKNRPMKAEHFQKIEKELHQHILTQRRQQDVQPKIDLWSTCFNNVDCTAFEQDVDLNEEQFYSLSGDNSPTLLEPALKGCHKSQGLVQKVSDAGIMPLTIQIDNKNAPTCNANPKPGLAAVTSFDDANNNITKACFKLSGLSITLLLKDPIGSTSDPQITHNNPLCTVSDRFFEKMSHTMFGSKDLEYIQETFNNACDQNNLRCFLATINISHEISTTNSCQTTISEVSVGVVELLECLMTRKSGGSKCDPELTQLLRLSSREDVGQTGYIKINPCLKAKYKNIQRSACPSSIQGRHTVIPKTEVETNLGNIEVLLDPTLIDRLHDLFYPSNNLHNDVSQSSPHYRNHGTRNDLNQQALFSRTMNEGSSCEQRTHILASAPNIRATLRFPVLDLRKPNLQRSWLKQELWKEKCILECNDVVFETNLQDSEDSSSYETRFRELQGFLQMEDDTELIEFCRVTKCHSAEDSNDANGFDLPRVVCYVQPSVSGPLLEEENSGDSSPDSLCDTYSLMKVEPSPFSSKPVMYDKEELVVPGDASEMKSFQEKASISSKLHIELNFPQVHINFCDQQFFEVIYNRFGNDLLLWEPRDFSTGSNGEYDVSIGNLVDLPARLAQNRLNVEQFEMCHSSLNNDPYSSDDDDDDEDGGKQIKTVHIAQKSPKSTFALTLNTTRTRVVMFPASKNENKDCFGKLLLSFTNAQLFNVFDYKGETNLCYTSLQASQCSLHQALSVDNVCKDMNDVFELGQLYRTIYETELGARVNESKTNLNETRAMFSLAVKSFLDVERNAKEFVVALSLSGSTLRHRVVHSDQMWLMQMIDFFCVDDEEIMGYIPPVVVTMLHVHFWDLTIHYRPLFLPYQLLIKADGFSISSNIITDSKTSILRFIIDNAVILISNTKQETVDIIKDYVSVADVDLFELSLHTINDPEMAMPKLSLTLSNNIVHFRTCSDSLSAFMDLIRYIANDGDFQFEPITDRETTTPINEIKDSPSTDAFPVEQRNQKMQSVDDLMTEAMAEANIDDNTNICNDSQVLESSSETPKHDVFVFRDESSAMQDSRERDLADAISTNQCGENDDDDFSDGEFCILEHPDKEPEVNYEEPKVKSFCDQIEIVSDHFSVPVGGVDQLKAPRDYPTPVYCYTIKEMSIIWQLYGGKDFEEAKPRKRTGHSIHSGVHGDLSEDDFDDDPVVINNHRGNQKPKYSTSKMNWKTNHGATRDLNTLVEVQLTKVRFQYEKYPEDKKQTWRQVLLIQDVEVRDRLSSSQINKFLYQHSTESRPKQTHANMAAIKMLGLRPEEEHASEEGCLKISLKPIRLYIDQDTLQFLINFFKDLSNTEESQEPDLCTENDGPTPQDNETANTIELTGTNSAEPPMFFRLFEFSPEVPIRFDYHGKHSDMGQGSIAGLLFAFGQLNCSEIRLRRLCQRSGLLGIERVINYALNEWGNDIKKTQIPGILGGVGPTYSFVQLVQGVKDLFWLPVEQYRRDGRIMRGLQRGASSFTTSSAMAFLELTNKFVQVVHGAAEVAYEMVSPETGANSRDQNMRRRVPCQPADFRQGMANAYNVVTEGFGKTASSIVQVAKEEHENKGMTGAVGGVLRHIPSAVVQPIILATEATSNVIGGVRNQILPDARREATEKWRFDE